MAHESTEAPLLDLSGRIRLVDVKQLMMTDLSARRCQAKIQSLSFWWKIKNDALFPSRTNALDLFMTLSGI